MPLLEALDQRIQERADEHFALFLASLDRELTRRLSSLGAEIMPCAALTPQFKRVEMQLRAIGPTITKLRKAAADIQSESFSADIDSYAGILNYVGMRADGGGGYHCLRSMDERDLNFIESTLHRIMPGILKQYQDWTAQKQAAYIFTRGSVKRMYFRDL